MSLPIPSLLINVTHPYALGALVVGLAAVGYVTWLVRRGPDTDAPTPTAPEESEAAPEDAGTDEAEAAPDTPSRAAGGQTIAQLLAGEEVEITWLLSRFVLDPSGDPVGETVAITDGYCVLKQEGAFLAVPQDMVIEKDGMLLADTSIDWEAAKKAGEAWQNESLDEIRYDDEGMPVLDDDS